jgi:hypothetical protein
MLDIHPSVPSAFLRRTMREVMWRLRSVAAADQYMAPLKSERLVSDWKPLEDVDVWAALLPHSLLCDDVRRREVAGCVTPIVQSANLILLSLFGRHDSGKTLQ